LKSTLLISAEEIKHVNKGSALKNIVIVYKPSKECLEKTDQLIAIARAKGFEVCAYSVDDLMRWEGDPPSLVMSVGGDGTLLKISRVFQQYTPLVLPIPCGRRAVFYEDISEEMYEKIFSDLMEGSYRIEILRRVRVYVPRAGVEYLSLNEALILSRDRGRVTGFTLTIKSVGLNTTLSFDGDGVLIGASTGSAAYNLSAGGPLIDYLLDALFVTPLNPMELNLPPIVVSTLSKIVVKSRGYTELYIDGEKMLDLKPHEEVMVEPSNRGFRVIRFYTTRDYVRRVLDKRKIVH